MEEKLSLSKKQDEIINLIFRFRFLSRVHLQQLLNHKDRSRVNKWLSQLIELEYIGRIYNENKWMDKAPAIYYLDKKGIYLIRKNYSEKNTYINKLKNEEKISFITKEHSLKCGDFYLYLSSYVKENNHTLKYFTKADLSNEILYQYIKPDAYFTYETPLGKSNAFVEIDLETESKTTLSKKFKIYIDYYYSFKWKVSYTKFYPTICIVCLTEKRVNQLIQVIEKDIDHYGYIPLVFRIMTFDTLSRKGIGAKICRTPFGKGELLKII